MLWRVSSRRCTACSRSVSSGLGMNHGGFTKVLKIWNIFRFSCTLYCIRISMYLEGETKTILSITVGTRVVQTVRSYFLHGQDCLLVVQSLQLTNSFYLPVKLGQHLYYRVQWQKVHCQKAITVRKTSAADLYSKRSEICTRCPYVCVFHVICVLCVCVSVFACSSIQQQAHTHTYSTHDSKN